MADPLGDPIEELHRRRALARTMGGPEKVQKQHARGKWTARERLGKLLDDGSFMEIGMLAWATEASTAKQHAPADGCIGGYGKIEGRPVAIVAEDFTVLGGSWGRSGSRKARRISETALRNGFPFVWLADGGGGRIQEEVGSEILNGEGGAVFHIMPRMKGKIPRVTAVMGTAFGVSAFMGGLADLLIMTKGTVMGMSGPPVIEAATGEVVTPQELGGTHIHYNLVGLADRLALSEEEVLELIKEFLSYLPSNSSLPPPRGPHDNSTLVKDEKLLEVLPERSNQGYDMHEIIRLIADEGRFFVFKPDFGLSVITALARIDGRSVGIVASQPKHMGGALQAHSATKAAKFIDLCGNFGIPLVFLCDTPGFLVGKQVEIDGTLAAAMKFHQAIHDARVPKIGLFIRKGFGLGYSVMVGAQPDVLAAWPTAEIGQMGPEAGVQVVFHRQLAEAADPTQLRDKLVAEWKGHINPWHAAERGFLDDVIDPAETRIFLARALDFITPSYRNGAYREH